MHPIARALIAVVLSRVDGGALHVSVGPVLAIGAHRGVSRIILHGSHGHRGVRIRVLFCDVSHGLLLHLNLLAACGVRPARRLVVGHVVWHSILGADQAVRCHVVHVLSQVLIQMMMAAWCHILLLLLVRHKVVLHGSVTRAHWRD